MLSAIFAVTDGEGLISSRFRRTAAMKEAATNTAVFGFLLGAIVRGISTFRLSGQVLLGDGGAFSLVPRLVPRFYGSSVLSEPKLDPNRLISLLNS
jgi:hypothetical protein